MPIRIVTAPLSVDELRGIAAEQFGDFAIRTDRQKSASNSMINVRPSQGNRSRGVEDPAVQERIRVVVARLILS